MDIKKWNHELGCDHRGYDALINPTLPTSLNALLADPSREGSFLNQIFKTD
jgi:hypothetical protein